MAIKVGINGFGRIGRNVLRAALHNPEIEFVATNDLTDTKTLAHLLKYDSTLGQLPMDVRADGDMIHYGDRKIKVFAVRDPAEIDWTGTGAEIVIESTGRFTDGAAAAKHRRGSVKKVIISAPASNEDLTIVLGVNNDMYDAAKHNIISNASCTTNCLAPFVKVLHDTFGVEKGSMTTIHSYTNDQSLLDAPHSDLRRARAAAINMIPTSTGAAKALGLVLPKLKGKLDGSSIRVPTPNVSVVDLKVVTGREVTVEEINAALQAAADGPMKGVLATTIEPLVSTDLNHIAASSTAALPQTQVVDGKLARVLTWYDNEWGFATRMADTALVMSKLI